MIRDDSEANAILAKVRDGELSPQAAEEWATSHDLPPFAGKPDPQGLDPMTEPLWTIPMALAWFIWRTRDAVIENTHEYQRHWRKWSIVPRLPDVIGDDFWDLIPVKKTSIADLLQHPDINRLPSDRLFDPSFSNLGRPFSVGESSPYRRLSEAIELGQIHASAISSKGGGRKSRRLPFPFLILELRSGLRSIRKKRTPETAEHEAVEAAHESGLPEYYSDDSQLDYFDIRVPLEEVISADIRASRLDYNWESWTTEYALGWIAYREIDKFRLLSPSNLGTVSRAAELRLGVKHVHPDADLLSALREGRLIARPSIEAMHLGDPNPIPPDWWKDRTLSDAPHLRFVRDDVTTLWTAQEIASSGVAHDIETSKDASAADSATAPIVDPWEPLRKLTLGERKVILEAKRHWPECNCLLRTDAVYHKINDNWDSDNLGPRYTEKTIMRALKLIPAWTTWRDRKRKRGHRAVGNSVSARGLEG